MAPPPRNTSSRNLKAAKPSREIFDVWHSSSTGHQTFRSQVAGSLPWQQLRTHRLQGQFGIDKSDERARAPVQRTLFDCLDPTKKKQNAAAATEQKPADKEQDEAETKNKVEVDEPPKKQNKLFANLNFYVNGSTYPTISDHKLKRLILEHGGNLSIVLKKKTVTHVILGTPNHGASGNGVGGGLASGKIQKEVTNVRGKGVKFVSVDWVIDSIKAGRRQPEERYANLKLAMKGQGRVFQGQMGQGQIASLDSTANEAQTDVPKEAAGEHG